MPDTSPVLSLPLIQPSQAQKHVTHNEAIDVLDALVQAAVQSADQSTPPAMPTSGDMYIVGVSPTGDWAAQEKALARYSNNTWRFFTPREGWRVWVADTSRMLVFGSGQWQELSVSEDQPITQLGINATADSVNRLSVNSSATLLNHEGAGHQLKINKAALTETASLLFQSSFSGRAEMGLAGSEDWSIRVSDDGTNWTTALEVDAATGQISGAAVQQSDSDATDGRLVITEGAGAAVMGHFGSYYGSSSGRDIDTVSAGDTGLYSISNPGTFPADAIAFVFVETQRMYTSDAVRQIATQYGGSGSNVIAPRQWVRLRSNSGTYSAWAEIFNQSSILGSVSQTAGLPTGALIETGVNANGAYVKYADGTLVCRYRTPSEVSVVKDATLDVTWTYPAAFAGALDVAVTLTPERASAANGSVPAICVATYRDGMTATAASVGITNLNTVSNFRYVLSATGRWF